MMRWFKVALVGFIFLMSALLIQPAYADRPNLESTTDYPQITARLAELIQARETKELPADIGSTAELQHWIAELYYQKYILETSEGSGRCSNETTHSIAVYGVAPKKSQSEYANTLYLLPAGEATDEDWSCTGVYVPNNTPVAGVDVEGASALRSLSGTQLVIQENPETGVLELNLPPIEVLSIGDASWEIPDLAEADLTRQLLPQAPID